MDLRGDNDRAEQDSADDAGVNAEVDRSTSDDRWLTPGIGGVSVASFFSDSGHEITTAVLPSFLTSTLHASAGALGVIEGVSDALVGAMKVIGGPLADNPRVRGPLATGGYLGTAVATGAVGLATTVWQAGFLRGLAWMSRGLRTPARDSLLAALAPPSAYGRAFGLERAGDNLGAVVGPLIAAVLVTTIGIRPTMYLAAIPGVFAAVAITVTAREARRQRVGADSRRMRLDLRGLRDAGLGRPMVPIALFEAGNMATTLLILRATQLLDTGGRTITQAASIAILIYSVHNVFAVLASAIGGRWIDRAGPQTVFAAAAALYVVAYVGLAVDWRTPPMLALFFAVAGIGIGLAETAESTLVASVLPDSLRGSGFGLLGGVQALGDLLASAVVGLVYATVSPAVAFVYAAVWMALSMAASCRVGR